MKEKDYLTMKTVSQYYNKLIRIDDCDIEGVLIKVKICCGGKWQFILEGKGLVSTSNRYKSNVYLIDNDSVEKK